MRIDSQRGWAALIVLVALAIVGYLARDSIARLLMPARIAAADSRLPAVAQPASDATHPVAMPSAPVERARAVEDVVRQQFERTGQRADAPR